MTDTYTKRAQRVVDGLAQATLLSNAGKDDQALALLASLKPDVAGLREAAKGMHEVVKSEEDLAQRKLHAVLEAIASTVTAENRTREQINKAEATKQGDIAKLNAAMADLQKYQHEMIELMHRINDLRNELHDNQDKMSKWFWVPGYNVYLAVKNIQDLINGKQGELNGVRQNLQDVQQKMPALQGDAQRLAQEINTLQGQLNNLVGTESALKQHQVQLDQAQKTQAAVVVTSAKVASFYDELAAALDDTKKSLESTYQIAARLAAPVEVLDANGNLRQGSLQLAVIYLAQHADAATQRIYVFENVDDGSPQWVSDLVIGTEPAGGYDHAIQLIPFKVTAPYHLRGVIIPMKGQDMIVQLATGPSVPGSSQPVHIAEPTVVVSKTLPGTTPFAAHDIPIPGAYVLVPGEQYFIILTSANLGRSAGTWTNDSRAKAPRGQRFRGEWIVWPRDERGGPSLRVYGMATVGNLQQMT
jgi:uncharacterized coiled-coil DUF342 family protein